MEDLKTFLEFTGLDLGTGQRGVDLMKEFKTADDLGKEFGYDVALPSLGGLSVNQFAAKNAKSMIPEGKEVIKYRGKDVLVDKDRPTGYKKFRAGLADYFNLKDFYANRGEQTDLDKMGGMATDKGYDPLGGLTVFDANDLSQLQLNPSIQRKAQEAYKQETAGMGTPTDTLPDAIKAYKEFKKASDTESRKGKILDNAIEFINMQAQTPFLMKTLKDASTFKQQQLLDAEAIKQGMPNALQARLLAADSGFAQQAAAIAGQADAATRMAGLGVFPRSAVFYSRT